MLEFYLHLDRMKRKHPFPIPLSGLGYTTDFPVSQTVAHENLFFSFIVKGSGILRVDNREYALTAPCVFLQLPGVPMHHSSREGWDELFAGYEPETVPLFRKMNLIRRGVPTWQIENYNEFMLVFNRVTELVGRGRGESGVPDMLDRLLQELILLSLQKGEGSGRDEKDVRVGRIIAYLERHCAEEINFLELVALHGLSYSSFIRRWRALFDVSPQKYLLQVRMKRASALLLETNLRISEIAEALGFDNAFYFSKVFRDFYGATASKYRGKFRKI